MADRVNAHPQERVLLLSPCGVFIAGNCQLLPSPNKYQQLPEPGTILDMGHPAGLTQAHTGPGPASGE